MCTWNYWRKSTPTARWQSPTQRNKHDQLQERCTTGRYHIAHAVHGSTQMHIPMTDLGTERLVDARRICLTRQIYMRTSSNDIKYGKGYVNHDIQGEKNKHLGKRKLQSHRRDWTSRKRNWSWAGHVSRIRDNRLTLRITTRKCYERERHIERPTRRWSDELDDYW